MMRLEYCRKKGKLDNRGSALVSVLVITTFITIIATTMLYMAAMNYQQKQTDYQNKQSFYGAEKALDEFKSILVSDVQDAYLYAYNETSKNFLWRKDDLTAYFQESFMNALNEKWKERVDDVTAADISGLQSIASMNDGQKKLLLAVRNVMEDAEETEYNDCAKYFYKIDSYGLYEDAAGAKKFALKGIQVKCTSGNYTTFLYTDICLEPPSVNWQTGFADATGATQEKAWETIAFTDCVYYVNWHRDDYDERDNYNTDLGNPAS